jgi:hypothetical protein
MLIGRLNMYTRLCKTYSKAKTPGEQAQAWREEVEAQSIAPKRTDESARAHDYQSSHREEEERDEEWDRQWMEALEFDKEPLPYGWTYKFVKLKTNIFFWSQPDTLIGRILMIENVILCSYT